MMPLCGRKRQLSTYKKLDGEVYNPGQKNIFIQTIIFGRMPPICSYEYVTKETEPAAPTPEATLGLKYSMRHFYVADNGELAAPLSGSDSPRKSWQTSSSGLAGWTAGTGT